jgi:hypothetical protein
MDDYQARELEALEGILCDPCAEPIKLSCGLTKTFSNEIGSGGFGVVYQVWSFLDCLANDKFHILPLLE